MGVKSLRFRPHIGGYFFIFFSRSGDVVPPKKCFRPHIGEYFFILSKHGTYTSREDVFPSPYWGVFFYRAYMKKIKELMK